MFRSNVRSLILVALLLVIVVPSPPSPHRKMGADEVVVVVEVISSVVSEEVTSNSKSSCKRRSVAVLGVGFLEEEGLGRGDLLEGLEWEAGSLDGVLRGMVVSEGEG